MLRMISSRLALELTRTTHRPWRSVESIPSICHARNYSATALNAPTPNQAPPKRFWKTVGMDIKNDHFAITLDNRPLKTPSGNPLLIPMKKRLVATLIANEWDILDKVLKPHALPMTSLASRAIDAMRDKKTREKTIESLLKYVDTDAISFFSDTPKSLVRLQNEHWKPLLAWFQERHNLQVKIHYSLLEAGQSPQTKASLLEILNSLDEWQLAAIERATFASKSLLIALALTQGQINAEQAAQAAHVEVNSQIEHWGEVEDTHDVDRHDMRRQLSSASCLL